VVSGQLNIYIK